MIGDKSEVIEYTDKKPQDEVFFITEIHTKKGKSDAQRKTYYRCFDMIGEHLGYSAEEVKQIFMKGCFGVRKIKVRNWEYEVSNIGSTENLNMEQAIFLIDCLTKFALDLGLGEIVTPRERRSLYESV